MFGILGQGVKVISEDEIKQAVSTVGEILQDL